MGSIVTQRPKRTDMPNCWSPDRSTRAGSDLGPPPPQRETTVNTTNKPYSIEVNRKFWGIVHAPDGYAAIRQVNEKLGNTVAATSNIQASPVLD